jgi:hypothetical protein
MQLQGLFVFGVVVCEFWHKGPKNPGKQAHVAPLVVL